MRSALVAIKSNTQFLAQASSLAKMRHPSILGTCLGVADDGAAVLTRTAYRNGRANRGDTR